MQSQLGIMIRFGLSLLLFCFMWIDMQTLFVFHCTYA